MHVLAKCIANYDKHILRLALRYNHTRRIGGSSLRPQTRHAFYSYYRCRKPDSSYTLGHDTNTHIRALIRIIMVNQGFPAVSVWDDPYEYGLSHTCMGSPYAYGQPIRVRAARTRMGKILVWDGTAPPCYKLG